MIVRVPARGPDPAGSNLTAIVQLLPGETEVQLLDAEKFWEAIMVPMVTALALSFVTITGCAAVDAPTYVDGKVRDCGETTI